MKHVTRAKKKPSRTVPKKGKEGTYDLKEWEWPQDCTKGGKPWDKNTRKLYIRDLFARGILDPRRQELASQMGVDRRTLYNDFEEIYQEGFDQGVVRQSSLLMGNALRNAVIEASDLVVKEKGKSKLQAISTLGSITKDFTDFFERFGLKKPVQEEVAAKVQVVWTDPTIEEKDGALQGKDKSRR